MNRPNLYDPLFELINPQTLIITPNRRLAATLHKLYQQYALSQDLTTWPTPDILPITSWQQRLWQDYISLTPASVPLLLNSAQEKFLWERVITSSKRYDSLLRTSEAADKACAAYGLLKQWRVALDDAAVHDLFHSAEDYIALYDWIVMFEQLCEQQNVCSANCLAELLVAIVEDRQVVLPAEIILVGFTDITPQMRCLLDVCVHAGGNVQTNFMENLDRSFAALRMTDTSCAGADEPTIPSEAPVILSVAKDHHQIKSHFHEASNPNITRINLADSDAEIRIMAKWAKQSYQENPHARIGCVIPGIENIRDRVQQIFTEVFADDNQLQSTTSTFNITAGKPLQQYPIIHTALTLLGLYKKTITLETFAHLLFTPFIGEAESERLRRAKFDLALRQANISNMNLRQLSAADNDHRLQLNNACPQLAERLRAFFASIDQADKQLSYTDWSKLFSMLLTELGWPGQRSLNSEEFQVVDSWLNLFTVFVSLDTVSEPVNFHQALQTLHKLCATTIFQAKTPDAPIQVMGLLEAAALPFDKIWIANMDDLSWPPQPNPNPFIPKRLQRELQMPHATAERELLFCQSLMQQFADCSSEIIYSYAEKNDELELQPSPLIRQFHAISVANLHLPESLTASEKIYNSKQIEWLQDDIAPPVTDHTKIRGGISVIQHQALCPFRSFARWRLHAQELESPLPGLRAKDRGTLVHKIMELIWNKLQDHQTLLAMDDEALQQLIQSTISTALLATPSSHTEYKHYLALEHKRLTKLITEWLTNEKLRAPFTVLTHEKRIDYTIGKINLSFRIDRIDLLADGKQFIIDYKTGKNNDLYAWFSERPEQPQLPLYTLIESQQTVGIAFAQIYPGKHSFIGISRYDLALKGVRPIADLKQADAIAWDEQVNQWKNVLSKLSDDFSLGIAIVDPKDDEKTCEWCKLKSLCRINEE